MFSLGSASKRIVFPMLRESAFTISLNSTSSASNVAVPVLLFPLARTRET
jgi:hypothetical protein